MMQTQHNSGMGTAPPAAGGRKPGGGAWVLFLLLGVLLLMVAGIVALLVNGASGSPGGSAARGQGGVPANGTTQPTLRQAARNQAAMQDARAAFVQGDYAKAAGILQTAVSLDARDQELRLLLAQALTGQKDYSQAYKQLEAAIAIGPPAAELHFDAGTIANKAGLVDRALEHYSMAQTANPREPKYPLYLGMIQIKLGQDDAARASLVRAVTLEPELAEGWGTLGEMELKSNALGLARDHFQKAKSFQPTAARWRLGEARVLKRQGDAEGALAILVALDQTDTATKPVADAIAECCGLLDRPLQAAQAYANAATAHPDDAELHYQAALWFKRADDAEMVRKYARRARELGDARAAELLAGLPG
jgi:tetratricopeptide (TPR) repeat protein